MAKTLLIQSFAELPVSGGIARPPSAAQRGIHLVFSWLCKLFAWLSALLVLFIALQVAFRAAPAVRAHGFALLLATTWDPNRKVYGILPEIWGTLYSATLATLMGAMFGVAVAVFLSEGFLGMFLFGALKTLNLQHHPLLARLPDRADGLLRNLIELLAAIPSVIYGLWGIFVLIPAIRPTCDWLHEHLAWVPLFRTPFRGPGMLPAVIVLSIMILPTVSALARGALDAVPMRLRVASYGLGATRWETILAVLLPAARRGIFAAIVLAFGRALGETMALAMLVGNAGIIDISLFSPASTLSALLANNFPEAGPEQVPVLMYAAGTLLLITLLVNMAGSRLLDSGPSWEKER